MRIEFEIDELVLDGFDPRDRYRIEDSIAVELATPVMELAVRRLASVGTSIPAARTPDVGPAMSHRRRVSNVVAASISEGIGAALAQQRAGGPERVPDTRTMRGRDL